MPLAFDQSYFEGTGDVGYSNYAHQHGYLDAELAFILSTFNPIGKTLDVGCGYGYLTQMLIDAGVDAQGIDVSAFAISKDVTTGSKISQLDFLKNPNSGFADKEFDLVVGVYVLECLEKLVDLQKAADEAKRIADRIYFVTSVGSPAPHYQATIAEYEAFVLDEFPAPTWSVTFSDGVAFQPARRCVIVPGA